MKLFYLYELTHFVPSKNFNSHQCINCEDWGVIYITEGSFVRYILVMHIIIIVLLPIIITGRIVSCLVLSGLIK